MTRARNQRISLDTAPYYGNLRVGVHATLQPVCRGTGRSTDARRIPYRTPRRT